MSRRKPSPSMSNENVYPIVMFWDVESCPLPSNYDARNLVPRINTALKEYDDRSNLSKIVICGSRKKLTEAKQRYITGCSVEFFPTPKRYLKCEVCNEEILRSNEPQDRFTRKKEVADVMLSEKLLFHAIETYKEKQVVILLVTGDKDFGPLIEDLQFNNNQYIILLASKVGANGDFKKLPRVTWSWDSMISEHTPSIVLWLKGNPGRR